ncbi:MAG: protein-L-isoaspartate(D-aspartate) O-methyltransferase [Pyrinomonadaceae bacterium]|nr:protein-L-isoaspartate(D-aspartate) O-methyltransferase [Pyrinomonadaceae bacterium]
MDEHQIPRQQMVDRLRDHYKIKDEAVLEVMNTVPRHLFLSDALKFQAYKDNALPIAGNQTISQPYIVARMTELLELGGQEKVLELGAGSGYQTVILSKLAGKVFSIERVQKLANEAQQRLDEFGIRNVTLQCADGTNGWELYSPFDGILVAAGSPEIPQPLLEQLKEGGKIVIPIGANERSQNLIRIKKTKDGFKQEDFGKCSFVPLIGEHGWENKG